MYKENDRIAQFISDKKDRISREIDDILYHAGEIQAELDSPETNLSRGLDLAGHMKNADEKFSGLEDEVIKLDNAAVFHSEQGKIESLVEGGYLPERFKREGEEIYNAIVQEADKTTAQTITEAAPVSPIGTKVVSETATKSDILVTEAPVQKIVSTHDQYLGDLAAITKFVSEHPEEILLDPAKIAGILAPGKEINKGLVKRVFRIMRAFALSRPDIVIEERIPSHRERISGKTTEFFIQTPKPKQPQVSSQHTQQEIVKPEEQSEAVSQLEFNYPNGQKAKGQIAYILEYLDKQLVSNEPTPSKVLNSLAPRLTESKNASVYIANYNRKGMLKKNGVDIVAQEITDSTYKEKEFRLHYRELSPDDLEILDAFLNTHHAQMSEICNDLPFGIHNFFPETVIEISQDNTSYQDDLIKEKRIRAFARLRSLLSHPEFNQLIVDINEQNSNVGLFILTFKDFAENDPDEWFTKCVECVNSTVDLKVTVDGEGLVNGAVNNHVHSSDVKKK